MTNWTRTEDYFCWKGIRVPDSRWDIPFLALMLGESKGFTKALADHAERLSYGACRQKLHLFGGTVKISLFDNKGNTILHCEIV